MPAAFDTETRDALLSDVLRLRAGKRSLNEVALELGVSKSLVFRLEREARDADISPPIPNGKTPAFAGVLPVHENGSYVELGRFPARIEDLHLHTISTGDGEEFHVVGRGNSVWTYSWPAAREELRRRLTTTEQIELEASGYGVLDVVQAHAYDEVSGWTGGTRPTRGAFEGMWAARERREELHVIAGEAGKHDTRAAEAVA
jgi:hypothetical protein